jgi:type IV pilus assembly protein PilC
LATLVEAGMPLLRGLRLLRDQAESRALRVIINDLSQSIENGSSFSEAVSFHPGTFNRLFVNMIKAGEIGGALEATLKRLAEFMEKSQKIKGRIKSAMFYPCAVLTVAVAILGLMMVFIVPRFATVFQGLLDGRPLPAFTLLVLRFSEIVKGHIWLGVVAIAAAAVLFSVGVRTQFGHALLDRIKLRMPVVGPVFRKSAISRFARTLGTLASSGVPLLQALTIVEETAGNRVVGRVVARVRESVKQGDPIAPTLKDSGIFPSMVAGMVDVGEQTGALPEMLMKIADTYDEEVDNAVGGMVSLLEPIMIVFLAVVVGSIVIAMFLPLVSFIPDGNSDHDRGFSL